MKRQFVTYAHRGASEYAPDNTLCSFYLGLLQNANGIETDVRRTRDGELALFHDDKLEWQTSGTGSVSDYTLEELKQIRVYTKSERSFYDRIVTLEDFLEHFSFRDLTFAIEIKERGIEKQTVDMLEKYNMCDKTYITSFDYENIKAAKEYMPKYKVGWLVREADEDIIARLEKIGGEQICPQAGFFSAEQAEVWHEKGLSVRAWGVFNEELMKRAYDSGADGMTVNFPDKLLEYIASKNGLHEER